MTAHVHAEVIKAWADDTSLPVQCRSGDHAEWQDLKKVAAACWHESHQYRIKPQPEPIGWRSVFGTGAVGYLLLTKGEAISDKFNSERPIALLEVRDDGTAHLHPVEA